MAKLFLVRHGQASFGHADYDRLSDLGREQARWLGAYFKERGVAFDRVVSGDLARQRDTASEILAAMAADPTTTTSDARLNEYDGQSLYAAYTGNADPHLHQQSDYRGYWQTFRAAYEAWIDDRLTDAAETWPEFCDRVQGALENACADTARDASVLAATSGGVISCAVAAILDAPGRTSIDLNFQIRNTAFCEIIAGKRGFRLLSFNSIPHLDRPDRHHAVTHV